MDTVLRSSYTCHGTSATEVQRVAPSTETGMLSAVALLKAVEAAELTVHYQGIFPLQQPGRLNFEALVRWRHPSLGTLAPHVFLPNDMGGGIGWSVTHFVLDSALRQCAAWHAAGYDVGVSVNVSPGPYANDVLA